jgi:hypothetical protein
MQIKIMDVSVLPEKREKGFYLWKPYLLLEKESGEKIFLNNNLILRFIV